MQRIYPSLKSVIYFISIFILILLVSTNSQAESATRAQSATYLVNQLFDGNDGTCSIVNCTFREAINAANANPGADTIRFIFAIPAVFEPAEPLPAITDPVTIDAITGTNSSCPTENDSADLNITLDGSSADYSGLDIQADNTVIRGLNIINWERLGIWVQADDVAIECNHIGIDNDGNVAGNGYQGIRIDGTNNVLGGTDWADRNVITGNVQGGVFVSPTADATKLYGNFVGTDLNGTSGIGNGVGREGILVRGDNSQIGDSTAQTSNVVGGHEFHGIYFLPADGDIPEGNQVGLNYVGIDRGMSVPIPNTRAGIWVQTGSIDTTIGVSQSARPVVAHNTGLGIGYSYFASDGGSGNQIRFAKTFANFGLGIAAADSLLLQNDPEDLLDYVTIESAFSNGVVNGRLENAAGDYIIDFYENETCDLSGYGEGEEWIASFNKTIPAPTIGSDFTFTLPSPPMAGNFLVATATFTSGDGNTSGYSQCFQVLDPAQDPIIVNSTGNAGDAVNGDGFCETVNNNCTLRAAIEEVNFQPAGSAPTRIDISADGIIQPLTALPTIIKPVVIDAILTNADAECPDEFGPGNIDVRVDGVNQSSGNGLTFGAGAAGSTVRGLSITRMPADGIHVDTSDITIVCNLIGVGPNGTSNSNGNEGNGITVDGGDNNIIGGTSFNQRNIISDNEGNGIELSGSGLANDNQILGNIIGLEADGVSDAGNELVGISISRGGGNQIGDSISRAKNIIAANVVYGIHVAGISAQSNQISGNWIGLGADGMASAETEQILGIFIDGAPDTTIGGDTPSHGNYIGRSNFIGGIQLDNSNSFDTLIQNNQIGMNVDGTDAGSMGYGILVSDGSNNNIFDNTIRFMEQDGIGISNLAEGIRIGRNSIYDNDGLGIDLGLDGVTANDGDADTDTGANLLMNFPELSGAFSNGLIEGESDGSIGGGVMYRLDVYESDSCDNLTDYGEGQTWLGAEFVAENVAFSIVLDTKPTLGKQVTATLTDPDGNTSEFSQCVEVEKRTFTVDQSGEFNTGNCTTTIDGDCSMRRAIELANAEPVGPVHIEFEFDLAWVTFPQSPLPTISQQVIIDGAANVGTVCPTVDSNGMLPVRIDGSSQGTGSGLVFGAGSDGSIVQAVTLAAFPDDAIQITSDVEDITIVCNQIGLSSLPNMGDGIEFAGEGHTIGGAGGSNHIEYNAGDGIKANGLTHLIEGNLVGSNDGAGLVMTGFGTEVFSNTVKVNGSHGLWLDGVTSAEIRTNTIDDNSGAGIRAEGTTLVGIIDNTIINNTNTGVALLDVAISTNVRLNQIGIDGTTPAGNGLHGVHIDEFGTQTWVDENIIAHNSRNGIRVDPTAVNNEFDENLIFLNNWIGIDLGEDGPTPNEPGDGDVGANLLQNSADITAADSSSGQITFDLDTNSGDYRVEFFRNDDCHSSDYGQGQVYLGSLETTTGNGQTVSFGAGQFTTGDELTTVVTHLNDTSRGNSSEFSECFEVTIPSAVALRDLNTETQRPLLLMAVSLLLITIILTSRGFISKRSSV